MALAPAAKTWALLRLEAAYGVLQNDEIETSFAEVSKSFAAIDEKERSKFTLADC
jgi:bifunctional pyridoxal-dependent enzyme with beta-cystathionase and maltose regulon repressor activities